MPILGPKGLSDAGTQTEADASCTMSVYEPVGAVAADGSADDGGGHGGDKGGQQ